jgi:iron complex transport system ATP-binding protein
VNGLTVHFQNLKILENVVLEARTHQVVGVLGPNGAGKTTLLRAALGLISYTGTVQLMGVELPHMDATERARVAAYVPQKSALNAPLTVFEVVEQGRYPHRGQASGAFDANRDAIRLALTDCDLLRLQSRRFTELSGGEQRRVLLARALATQAPLVLLDEPTSGLDIRHALELRELIRRLASAGRSFVMVLHDLNEAVHLCDRAVLLLDGKVFAEGKPRHLLENNTIREVFGVELLERSAFGYRLPGASRPDPLVAEAQASLEGSTAPGNNT